MTAPTPEAFLADTRPDEDDVEHLPEATHFRLGHLMALPPSPMESIAESLRTIAGTFGVSASLAQASDDYADEIRQLGEAYDDLEAKHQSLYELLAEVEKIVAKSTSRVSLDVKGAINRWRNPEVPVINEAEQLGQPTEPERIVDPAEQCPTCLRYFADADLLARHECSAAQPLEPPAYDADVEEWREYVRLHGVDGAAQMNRSQIRTVLGISQPTGQA